MTDTKVRTNSYPGTCVRCDEQVDAGAGELLRHEGGGRRKWDVRHVVCPRDVVVVPTVPVIPWAERPLADRIEDTLKRNPYLAGKLGLVESATSYDEAIERINRSSQGMTMDYMTEFSQERTANSLACERAAEKFEVVR